MWLNASLPALEILEDPRRSFQGQIGLAMVTVARFVSSPESFLDFVN